MARINEHNAFIIPCVVPDDESDWNTSVNKHVLWKTDDRFDLMILDQLFSDGFFFVASE